MICSFFSPSKTVWDITQEIINILNMYEYPKVPFFLSGIQGIRLRTFDVLEEYDFSLQQQLDLWYMERKFENWPSKIEHNELSQQVLLCLKAARIKDRPLFTLQEKVLLSENYYIDRIRSYITDLKAIILMLTKWLYFLFTLESKIYGIGKVHYSLKELFCKEVI